MNIIVRNNISSKLKNLLPKSATILIQIVVFHTDQPHILALSVFANAQFQRSKNQKS